MRQTEPTTRVAAVQAAPVFLDREATVQKSVSLIEKAGGHGARLVVFPEAFIPTYPDWVWAVPPGDGIGGTLYGRLLDNAVTVPSDVTKTIGDAAARAGAYVVMGISEVNDTGSRTSLYNTLLYFDDSGNLIGRHRKRVPTAGERLVWAPGDGSTLEVFDAPFGRLGGLICWENYMPLARYALYAAGVQIYVAPTWDRGESWIPTLQHIAKEGGVYVIGCCMLLRNSDIPDSFEIKHTNYDEPGKVINRGRSAIVDPQGTIVAGPLDGLEGILYADVRLEDIQSARWMLDVAGHYARPDVFDLHVNRSPRPVTRATEEPEASGGNEVSGPRVGIPVERDRE